MSKTLMDAIFNRTLETLLRPSVPVSNSSAKEVAREVTQQIAPVIVNATNAEPWYRSRIYLGLIAAGLGAVASHFGVQISGADIQLITNSIPELLQLGGEIVEIGGLLYAAYGRAVGSRKKPLGS